MISLNSSDFDFNASWSIFIAGFKLLFNSTATDIWIAVGNVSLELCDLLTWSLGCTGSLEPNFPPSISIALLLIT